MKHQTTCPKIWVHLDWRAAARQVKATDAAEDLVGFDGFSADVCGRGAAEGQQRGGTGGHELSCSGV